MKSIVKIFYIIFCMLTLYYLTLPNLEFPIPPDDTLQSDEPADTESKFRKAYFTNYEREDVVTYYYEGYKLNGLKFQNLYPLRLNLPPEDAQNIIRDQTRSSYLEEIVYPMRESLYINGFKPTSAKDAILINERNWVQKITVRHIQSEVITRLIIGVLSLAAIYVLYGHVSVTSSELKMIVKKIVNK